jgi:hypothetical protein
MPWALRILVAGHEAAVRGATAMLVACGVASTRD